MKNDLTCPVVRDLLPSYAEGLTAPETNDAVERHLEGCPDCTACLAAMRTPEAEIPPETVREVDYLKKVKRRGWKRVVLAILLTLLAVTGALAAKLFLIGSPASPDTMAARTRTEDETLWVEVSSVASGNAWWGWDTEVENGIVRITAREGLVSVFHPTASGKVGIPLEGLEEVYLCGRLIWQDGMEISPDTWALMEARTPYVGNASALNRITQALYNRIPAPYTMELKTSARPYRWTLVYPEDLFLNGYARDAASLDARLVSLAPVLLALVDNLDEVAWTYPDSDGHMQSHVVTCEEATAALADQVAAYNAANGTDWEAPASVKDCASSPAALQRLVILAEFWLDNASA